MSRKKPFPGPPHEDESLLLEVRAGLRCLGWLVPQREIAVASDEGGAAVRPTPLPPGLRDPSAVFRGKASREAAEGARLPASAEVQRAMSRAAREAGRITPQIEERMRRDRKAAEERMDNGRPEGEKG